MTLGGLMNVGRYVLVAWFGVGCTSVDPTDSGGDSEVPDTDSGAPPDSNVDTDVPDTDVPDTDVADTDDTDIEALPARMAFFYQTVGNEDNAVMAGSTLDGFEIDSAGFTSIAWEGPMVADNRYSDPVVSRMPDGTWTVTSRSAPTDSHGAHLLMYSENSCPEFPEIDDPNIHYLSALEGSECITQTRTLMAKTSQVFEADGEWYVFHAVESELWLAHLGNAEQRPTELAGLCFVDNDELPAVGQTERIYSDQAEGWLISDAAISRRTDGTWVLFIKGIEDGLCDTNGGLCELCGRQIFRTTSEDLVEWTALESVMTQASIPESTVDADGRVWLYWQDFTPACDAQDLFLANRAPISGAYEDAVGDLTSEGFVSFPEETFERDTNQHYATNSNPVRVPGEAWADFLECVD